MRLVLINVFTILVLAANAQSLLSPSALVEAERKQNNPFTPIDLFDGNIEKKNLQGRLEKDVQHYQLFHLKPSQLSQLTHKAPNSIRLDIPSPDGELLEIELVQVNIYADGFNVIESKTKKPVVYQKPIHYRGVLKGKNQSLVTFSVLGNEVMGLISAPKLGNLVLGKLQLDYTASPQDKYILYRDDQLTELEEFSCAMEDDGIGYTMEELEEPLQTRSLSDCVNIYFEVDFGIYQNKGGTNGATNFVSGIFNQVATLYANEDINVKISEIFVWNTSSPYSGSNSSTLLSQFQSVRSNFNGDLGQLLSYRASGGIAAGFSGLCNSNRRNSLSFSSISSSYSTVPTYSYTVMVVTHELGHLFGSRHTHACVWNGNNTAIDGCAGSTEGFCTNPGYPSQGGTIMSYCHLQNVGINFNQGFGPQPGAVIRNRVTNASCLDACDDDGGGDDQNCEYNEVDLTITLDRYGSETTWEIRNSEGTALYSGGPYSNNTTGAQIKESFCLVDDCYSFYIRDSYGDGICCNYGEGSYVLEKADGTTLLSGGAFADEEEKEFCFNQDDNGDGGEDCETNELIFNLVLDRYGAETTWELRDDTDFVLYSGGPYSNGTNGAEITEAFCVVDDCYTFEIKDSYGDGICCAYGTGSYTLSDSSGTILVEGGAFESIETKNFCVGGDDGDGGDDDSSCLGIDLSMETVVTYDPAQDFGVAELLEEGTILRIKDNAWKAILLDYAITENTVLEFDFGSTQNGEILGIGFDSDGTISADLTFRLAGTQNYGLSDFATYDNFGYWASFVIPVGQYYTGAADRIFFVADHDSGQPKGNAYFRNILIHEGDDCSGIFPVANFIEIEEAVGTLNIYPNPARNYLDLSYTGKIEGKATIRIYNFMGQLIEQQQVGSLGNNLQERVKVDRLAPGTYYLELETSNNKVAKQFIKAR